MRASRLSFALVLAVLLLTGCVPDPAPEPFEPQPSSTPVFASEEEALAAAVAAYENYLRVSDEILQEGGDRPERIEMVAGEPFLGILLDGFEQMRTMGWTSVGSTGMRGEVLQSFDTGELVIYVCEDVAGVDVQNGSGTSVVSPGRPDSTLFLAKISVRGDQRLVTSREVWSDEEC